jgi:putative methionine-R-sulfoxide reductase with GAF domain
VAAHRDYPTLVAAARGLRGLPLEEAMGRCTRLMWDAYSPLTEPSLSWIGFYRREGLDAPVGEEMTLICREPKPACSPIGLHGMCGRGWQEARPIVIADVRTLGAGYIACDPRDQSELVVPVILADGTCWGVLDADSYDVGAFTEDDAAGMGAILEAAGISHPREGNRRVMRL